MLLTLLATLPIALRRRFPLPVLAITLAAALAADLAYDSFPFPGPLVAVYSVGAHVCRPTSLYAAGATAAALPSCCSETATSASGSWRRSSRASPPPGCWATTGAAGASARAVESERQANVQRTAAEEQARMARELHDIIGHSVSVMTIQAAAAGDAFDSRPAQVREALRAIESTGREALAELRRLLAGAQADGFAPAPGLETSTPWSSACGPPAWPSSCRSTAGRSRCRPASTCPRTGSCRRRSPTRSSTRTRRRRGSRCARPAARWRSTSSTTGRARAALTPGHGIIGMRERAALFGGHLSAGPAPGGGFAVRARIPVGEPVP